MTDHKRTYSQRGDDYLLEAWKVCEKEKPAPRCPYCGHKMGRYYAYDDFFFRCPKCRVASPDRDTEAEAYEAAMQRWKEPNRVLTLDELREYCKQDAGAAPLWVEFSGIPSASRWMVACTPNETFCNDTIRNYCGCLFTVYKKAWRCWIRKPTREEMEAVTWEGD